MSLVLVEPLPGAEPGAQVEGALVIRLNRPEKRNAINAAMAAAAIAALDAAEADPAVRVIVLTGTGASFCAGQDMAEATGRGSDSPTAGATAPAASLGAGALNARLARVTRPVIAAINGYCIGGGTVTALHCDIRLAAEEATFRFPGAAYGLVVAASLLPAVVGQARAKDLILTGRTVGAAEAFSMGLVNRVVPGPELPALVADYARMIAANSPDAVRHAKAVIDLATLDQAAIAHEAEVTRGLRQSDQHRSRFSAAADRVVGKS